MSFLLNFVRENFFTHAHLMAIKQIRSCTILNCLPFKVQDNKIVLTESKFSKTMEKVNLILSTIMISIFFIKLAYKMKTTELKITQMLLYAGWSTLISCNYLFKLQYFDKKQESVLLYNGMHELERRQIKKGFHLLSLSIIFNLKLQT